MGACFGKKKGESEEQAADSMKVATFGVSPRRETSPYITWWRLLGYFMPEPAQRNLQPNAT